MKNFLLSIVVIAVSLLAAEGVLRLAGYRPFHYRNYSHRLNTNQEPMYSKDPETGYMVKPGIYHFSFLPNKQYPVTVTISKNKSRYPLKGRRPQHPYLYFVGGSVCFGIGVSDKNVFSSVISKKTGYGEQNQCVGGYGTLQSLQRLERTAQTWTPHHQPAAIIYAMINHHMWRNVVNGNWIIGLDHGNPRKYGLKLPYARLDKKGHVTIHAPDIYKAWPFRSHSALINLLESAYVHLKWDTSYQEAFEVTVQLVDRMSKIAKQYHIPFYVVQVYTSDKDFHRFQNRFNQLGIPSFQCTDHAYCPSYKRCQAYSVPNDGHPNAKVHRYFANCIIKKVLTPHSLL